MLRKWGLFIMTLLCVGIATAQSETATRDWRATRNPCQTEKPSVANRDGSDYTLFDRNTTPLSLGLFAPVQIPWGDRDVRGLRLSPLYGRCDTLTGVDLGLWNAVNKKAIGLQVGGINTAMDMRGMQVGAINVASFLKGVQIGVVNYAEGARGLQIGLVNVITESSLGFFPIIYGSF